MSDLIISVSGLRGIVGETLTPDVAIRFVTAYAGQLEPGAIVVSRDGRASGRMLCDVIRGALNAVGRDVIDADVAATPTTGRLVRQQQAAGGIQISASHNPAPYNGIKLFDADGKVIDAETGKQVIAGYHAQSPAWQPHAEIGQTTVCHDTLSDHAEAILAQVDIDRIRERKFRVLLDSNHGAGSLLGRHLLQALGCNVTCLGDTPDGAFEHTPEPTAANLASVSDRVQALDVDVCFCQDPDADRLAVIDAQGRYLGEEYSLALCLDHVLRSLQGVVVANCATSLMSEAITLAHGSTFLRSAVGEANVVALMQSHAAVFGGEGNGGPIDPRVGYVRDSFVGMALILDSMASRNLPVSALADSLPSFAIHKTTTPLAREQLAAAYDALETQFPDAESSRLDGLRLTWPDRWLLVRASNTEPIVRLIAEATTSEQAEMLCSAANSTLSTLSP